MSYCRVMTDDGVRGGPHRFVYQGQDATEACLAFASCLPKEGSVLLEYDRHIVTDEPALVMRRPSDNKTLAAMWGVTMEQWEEFLERK